MYHKSKRTIALESKRKRCAQMRSAKERKRMAESSQWSDVGGFVTDGVLGVHSVRLLMSESYSDAVYAVKVDGKHRLPRSLLGVKRCMAEMLYRKFAWKQARKVQA